MKCMSWSSRSASTRTVEEPPAWAALLGGGRRRGGRGARRPARSRGDDGGLGRRVGASSAVERRVGDGLDDVDVGDVRHGAGGAGELGVGALGDDPRVDRRGRRTCRRLVRRGTQASVSPSSASAESTM